MRIQQTLQVYSTPIQPVLTFKTPEIYSHNLRLPQIDLEVVDVRSSETPHHVVRGKFKNLIAEKYNNHKIIFTDGSKSKRGVGSAAVMDANKKTMSLPLVSTVFTAEVMALRLAAKLLKENLVGDKYLVCSDSLSVLQEMENVMTKDHLVHRVQIEFHDIIASGVDVTFAWVPSHVGVEGNEKADIAAKRASRRAPEFVPIPYRNWFPEIKNRTHELCLDSTMERGKPRFL